VCIGVGACDYFLFVCVCAPEEQEAAPSAFAKPGGRPAAARVQPTQPKRTWHIHHQGLRLRLWLWLVFLLHCRRQRHWRRCQHARRPRCACAVAVAAAAAPAMSLVGPQENAPGLGCRQRGRALWPSLFQRRGHLDACLCGWWRVGCVCGSGQWRARGINFPIAVAGPRPVGV
jgi:hypothetical protein